MKNFKTLLKEKGLKSTAQRVLMLKTIEEAGHIDMDTLHKKMSELTPSISLNTIYLNLEQLAKQGLIAKVSLSSQKNVYETVKEQHIHLVCTACGNIMDKEIENNTLAKMKEGALSGGFTPSLVAVNIYGVCKKCTDNQTTKEHR
jgi:Fe2+ or Zn2+ uptake regulation protein